jgi:hypothetical protein
MCAFTDTSNKYRDPVGEREREREIERERENERRSHHLSLVHALCQHVDDGVQVLGK